MTEWIEIAGDKLFATPSMVIREKLPEMFIKSNKNYNEHSSPRFENINWINLINSLREINYQFPVNFKTGGRPNDDPRKSYQQAVAWWCNCEQIYYNRIKKD